MNNNSSLESLQFEVNTLEDILYDLIEVEQTKGYNAIKAALVENIESARREIEDRGKSDSELRHLSGYLTGLRFFDTFKDELTYHIQFKKEQILRLIDGVDE